MTEDEALEIFKRCGALHEGHYVLASGQHSDMFINKVALYARPLQTSRICQALAEPFKDMPIDVVAAPVMGGIVLTQWLAYHLTLLKGPGPLAVFADKVPYDNGFEFKRGYAELVRGKNILVTEDILTTGGSARKVVDLARTIGGNVIGLAALWNRGDVSDEALGSPGKTFSLITRKIETWVKDDCPQCKAGLEVSTKLGRG